MIRLGIVVVMGQSIWYRLTKPFVGQQCPTKRKVFYFYEMGEKTIFDIVNQIQIANKMNRLKVVRYLWDTNTRRCTYPSLTKQIVSKLPTRDSAQTQDESSQSCETLFLLSVWYEKMTKIFSNFVRFWRVKAFWKAEKKLISEVFTHDIKKTPQHYVKLRRRLNWEKRDHHFLRQ